MTDGDLVGRAAMPLKVSIIVPVFNAGERLAPCIRSILAQDYDQLEVLLIDDGSSDGSDAVCDMFASADARVRVAHQANGGIAVAQNSGLDLATGELITFCDNDDLMHPRMISRLVEILVESGADMSCCRWRNPGASEAQANLDAHADDAPGRVVVFDEPGRRYQEVFSKFLRVLHRTEPYYFSEANWGKLYRAALFDGIRFPPGKYAQDVAVAMDLYRRMASVASCDDALYWWVQHAGSVSHGMRATGYYHDIVQAHRRSFEAALDAGITPARAYCGLKTLGVERRSVRSGADARTYDEDRQVVRALLRRLSLRQRWRCWLRYAIRMAEVRVYNLTIHRRR